MWREERITRRTLSTPFGGLVYSHICSPIEPFLTRGYNNQFGFDLFQTLSPPPVGNVADLAAARKIVDPNVCTRGNIGLDLLLKGTPAASDYLFYDIPLENVQMLVRTASATI